MNANSDKENCARVLSQCLIERELSLEEEMFNRGRDRFFANVNRLREQKNEGGTSYGKILLKRGIEPLANAIDEFMAKAKAGGAGRRHMAVGLLEGMDSNVVAFITLRTVIDTLTDQPVLQKIAVRIGREIEVEQRLSNLKDKDKNRYQATQRYIQGHKSRKYRSTVLKYACGQSETTDFEPWQEVNCFHLGQKLIDLAIESTGFFSTFRQPGCDNTPYKLITTKKLEEWIDRHLEKASVMYPDYMPTVIPPKPWEGASGGGYYFSEIRPLSLVKTTDRAYLNLLDKKIERGEMPDVLTAVNALQNTAWTINKPVYEVAQHLWDYTDGGVADMPPRDGYKLPV